MAAEFSDLSLDQLDDQLVKLKKEQFNLRFQKAVGQIEDLTAPRRTQRTISRLMTVLRERQLAVQAAKKGG